MFLGRNDVLITIYGANGNNITINVNVYISRAFVHNTFLYGLFLFPGQINFVKTYREQRPNNITIILSLLTCSRFAMKVCGDDYYAAFVVNTTKSSTIITKEEINQQ